VIAAARYRSRQQLADICQGALNPPIKFRGPPRSEHEERNPRELLAEFLLEKVREAPAFRAERRRGASPGWHPLPARHKVTIAADVQWHSPVADVPERGEHSGQDCRQCRNRLCDFARSKMRTVINGLRFMVPGRRPARCAD
jgi:hypothetical protein